MLGLNYILERFSSPYTNELGYGRFEAACLQNRIHRRVRVLERAVERCTHTAGLAELEGALERYRALHHMIDPRGLSCGDRVIVDTPLRPGIHQRHGIILGRMGSNVAVRIECQPTAEDIILSMHDIVRLPLGELAGEWHSLRRDAGIALRKGARLEGCAVDNTRTGTVHSQHHPPHTFVRRLVMRYRLAPPINRRTARHALSMVTATMILLPLIVGCQQPAARYQAELVRAHRALEVGHTGQASRALASADQLAQQHRLSRAIAHDLLEAELHLQEGDALTALTITQQVASTAPSHSIDRAMAEEIIGKSAIRHGEFEAALAHFDTAAALYESEEDHGRIADLTLLARGLAAYASGDLGSAQQEWSAIANDELRSALDQARNDVEVAARY